MKWVLKVLLKHGLGRWPERVHRPDNLAGQRIDDESGAARLDRKRKKTSNDDWTN
jgi:hypothetical protein